MKLPSLSSDTLAHVSQSPWWVIHTRPRCEKKMDQWLSDRAFSHYLPVRPKQRFYPGKRVVFEHPLFPGYAFGAFPLLQRNAVYGSGFAAGILEIVDQERFLRELSQIQLALENGAEAEPCPYLVMGRRARITSGHMRGLEGVLLKQGSKTNLILSVELLQRSVAVEVHPSLLEMVE